MWKEGFISYCFCTALSSTGERMLFSMFVIKYSHLIELRVNKCLIATKKYLTAFVSKTDASDFFLLVLCTELHALENTASSNPIYILLPFYSQHHGLHVVPSLWHFPGDISGQTFCPQQHKHCRPGFLHCSFKAWSSALRTEFCSE